MAHSHENIEYGINEVKEVFNAAIMTGTIVSVDVPNDKADVNIGGIGTIGDVPIFYHCPGKSEVVGGAAAFTDGDSVYILNKEGKVNPQATDLQIVGFVDGLKPCGGFVVVRYPNPIDRCFVWDVENNQLAAFEDSQGDPIVFPCDYADIEQFLSASHDDTINWSLNTPHSIIEDCILANWVGCICSCPDPNCSASDSDSDSCNDSEATPGRPGEIDSVARLKTCSCSCVSTGSGTPWHEVYHSEGVSHESKTIIWKNMHPGVKAEYDTFSALIVAERNSLESRDTTALHDQDCYPSGGGPCVGSMSQSCIYDKSETHKTITPLLGSNLYTLQPFIRRSWDMDGDPCEPDPYLNADYTCAKSRQYYDFLLQPFSKISEKAIVNIFIIQTIKKTRTASGNGEPTCRILDPTELCEALNLAEGSLVIHPREYEVEASVNYEETGTDGVNPFTKSVHSAFTAEVKTLIDEYFTQIANPYIQAIPLLVTIH